MATSPELSSIIVPCCNELAFTQACLQSIRAQTNGPYELLLIDNGSADGTADFFDQFARQGTPGVERTLVIRNAHNRGYVAGVNQGLQAAQGKYLVLLNNDTLVTPGWLECMTLCAKHGAGLVGPTSNYVPAPQYVEPGYQKLEDLNVFAEKRWQEFRGKALRVERLSGFCLLMRRAVLQRIGLLDERFGLGFFEDDDLCFRSRDAGFDLAIALDVYIHHFGSRTFTGLGLQTEKIFQDNFKQFQSKWGALRTSGYQLLNGQAQNSEPIITQAAPSDESQVIQSEEVPGSARVSLTMIVKNEEDNLAACLEDVRELVHEIVVVDTGSSDRTKEIALSFGAIVIDFPWVDSFAAARNVAIEHATGDYAFWLDADDRIDRENQVKLKRLFETLRRDEQNGYVMKCACLPDPQGNTSTVVDHVRLFPLRPEIRWSYRVHEQILPALRRSGGDVQWSDVVIQHTGYVDATLRRRKLERDLRLLDLENQEHPDDPFTLFNLGSVYLELNNPQAALPCLERSLNRSAVTDSIVRKLFALISITHRALGNEDAAVQTCMRGRQYYPLDAELLFREAVIRRQMRDHPGAVSCLEKLLAEPEGEHFASVDADLRGSRARDLLAHVLLEMKQYQKAEEQWNYILSEDSKSLPGYLGLAELYLAEKNWQCFDQNLDQVARFATDEQTMPLLKARAMLAQQRFDEARIVIMEMIEKHSNALPWRVLLSHAYLQEGTNWKAAEQSLRDILDLAPNHSEARQNLAVLLRQHGSRS